MRYAEATDVAEQWRPIEEDSDLQRKVEKLLDIASAKLRGHLAGLNTRIASGAEPDLRQLTNWTVVSMVMRVLKNPTGIRQSSVGPTSVTFDLAAASGLLTVEPDEIADLQPRNVGGVAMGTVFVQLPRW
jgi:hypothetical protein